MKKTAITAIITALIFLVPGCGTIHEEPQMLTREEVHGIKMDDTQANNALMNRDIEAIKALGARFADAIFNVGDDHAVLGLEQFLPDREHSDKIVSDFAFARVMSSLHGHRVIEINMEDPNRGAMLLMADTDYGSIRIEDGRYIILSHIIFRRTTENIFVGEFFEITEGIRWQGDTVLVWNEAQRTHQLVNIADAHNYEEVHING